MILDDIKLKQKRLKEKNEKIEELKYEKNLIENDLINYIKTELFNSWDYNLITNNIIIEKAWKYLHHKKELKEYKNIFDYVITIIKEQILNNDNNYKLVDIYDCYFGTAYEFHYDYNGIKISISIPVYNNANKENYITLLGGYYIRYESSPCVWDLITNNIDYKQAAEELKTWIKNHKES